MTNSGILLQCHALVPTVSCRGQHASPEQRQKMMEALERDHQAEAGAVPINIWIVSSVCAASLEQLQAGLEELDLGA